jgi:hypothetical protein
VVPSELFGVVVRVASGEAFRRRVVEGDAPHHAPAGVAVEVAGDALVREDVQDLLLVAAAQDGCQDVYLDAVLDHVSKVEGVARLGLGTLPEDLGGDLRDNQPHPEALADASQEVLEERQLGPVEGHLVEDVRVLQELDSLFDVLDPRAVRRDDQVVLGQGGEEALQLLHVLGLEAIGVDGGLFGHGLSLSVPHVAAATNSS